MKPSYKHTEVGPIPEAWEVRRCSDLSERITVGIVIRPTQYYVPQGVPALRSANIRENGISNTDLVFISEASNALLTKSLTRAGDILTVRTGYPGTSAVVRPAHAGCNCIDILITRPTKNVDSDYLAMWINSPLGKEQVLRNQGGMAQKHFNVGDMRELKVACPPLSEQRAIATALSDVDALIAAQEELIAKKRAIKTATMQQLLTGKRRLPPFSGPWPIACLGELGQFRSGNGFPLEFQGRPSGLYPFFKVSDMNNEGNSMFMKSANHWLTQDHQEALHATVFPAFKTIVFAKIGAAIFLERKRILNKESCLDNNLMGFIVNESLGYPGFLYQELLQTRLSGLAASTALPSLSGTQISRIEIPLPPLPEQRAIATVLSHMDAEILALEARLRKTRDIKQGMMQQLLTGRIRLV